MTPQAIDIVISGGLIERVRTFLCVPRTFPERTRNLAISLTKYPNYAILLGYFGSFSLGADGAGDPVYRAIPGAAWLERIPAHAQEEGNDPMPKRAIPSLDQTVRDAIEWLEVNFDVFFHDAGSEDVRFQKFCSLIFPAKWPLDRLAHVHAIRRSCRSRISYGTSPSADGSTAAHAAPPPGSRATTSGGTSMSCFTGDIEYVLGYGGVYVFVCQLCRKAPPSADGADLHEAVIKMRKLPRR